MKETTWTAEDQGVNIHWANGDNWSNGAAESPDVVTFNNSEEDPSGASLPDTGPATAGAFVVYISGYYNNFLNLTDFIPSTNGASSVTLTTLDSSGLPLTVNLATYVNGLVAEEIAQFSVGTGGLLTVGPEGFTLTGAQLTITGSGGVILDGPVVIPGLLSTGVCTGSVDFGDCQCALSNDAVLADLEVDFGRTAIHASAGVTVDGDDAVSVDNDDADMFGRASCLVVTNVTNIGAKALRVWGADIASSTGNTNVQIRPDVPSGGMLLGLAA